MKRTACFVMISMLAAVSSLTAEPDAELIEHEYLSEVTRHLYRWYLDERDVMPSIHRGQFVFWVTQIERELDEDDNSRFAEITLPRLGIVVDVKKAHYEIPELDLVVKNESYKVTSVDRQMPSETMPEGAIKVTLPYEQMRDYLFQTRNKMEAPTGKLLEQMRAAANEEYDEYRTARALPEPDGRQLVYLGPISSVANEIWVYWETGRLLMRFQSDMDLTNPGVLEHDELPVKIFDIDEQVVVSLDEVPGSNAYLTRDQVGRVLYNCMVFGKSLTSEPDPKVED
jgi:hypothetical protein